MMLLSYVTGTFNRLNSLRRNIDSVVSQIPRHIEYEIIVVDGGSTDSTIEWCKAQSDIKLLEHGELKGAIKAFSDGARVATGEYVLLGNDDVVFRPHSIVRAIAHLEDRRECGAVAFADNRSAQLGYSGDHRVEQMPGMLQDGSPTMLNYAQVGLFRRWLGDYVGWWGDQDEIMGSARTYGGDNYLSSRIWEMGYSIDAVETCVVDDLIVRDGLRNHNGVSAKNDSRLYYERYPKGARYPGAPILKDPYEHHLRILVCPIYEPRFPARFNKEYGLSEALAKIGLTYEIDYVNDRATDIVEAVKVWRPHLMLTQIHAAHSRLNAHVLSQCRNACPEMVIVNWNGDAHESGLLAPDVMECLRQVDLQTVVNAKVLPKYERANIRAAYWQIAYKQPIEPLPDAPKHNAVMLMNCYSSRRREISKLLKECGVTIYGRCDEAVGNTHYDFALSAAIYQNAKLTISDTFPGTEGYVSNRLLQAMGAGVLVLQEYSPRLDELMGICAGKHYIQWNSLDELPGLIAHWLSGRQNKARKHIARAGQDFIREHFNYDAQVKKLFDLL